MIDPVCSRALPLLAAVLATPCFVAMDATIKSLAPRYGTLQLTFFRFAAGLALAFAIWLVWRTPMPERGQWRFHAARSVLLLVTLGAYFHAISVLPLAQAVALGYTAPLFISLAAIAWLGERPTRWIWLAMGLGLAGALWSLGPELARADAVRLSGLIAVLVSAVSFAGVMVLSRLQAQRESLPTFLLLQNVLPLLLLAAPVTMAWRPVHASDLPAIGAVGVFATGGLLLFTWAIRHLEASRVAPVEYTGFVWASSIGYVFFGEVPSSQTLVSAALIVGGCLFLLRR